MSRSYKHTPYCGDTKHNKEVANRRIRRKMRNPEFEMANGKAYKKHYCSWEICDFCHKKSFESYYRSSVERAIRFNEPIPSKEKLYKQWYKWYKMK